MSKELTSARTQAVFASVVAVVFGGLLIACMAVAYGLFAGELKTVAGENPRTTIFQLVRALRAFTFVAIPGLGLMLIGVGLATLGYFRKERRTGSATPAEGAL